ncbi:MAG TPA: IS110 family transposase [Candidatus Tectomicrobia bacterium]
MSVLGIDIAKLVFHVVGMDDAGHVVLRKRMARSELLPFIANLSPLCIGMEACGSAHYWARCFREHGHEVRLIAPQFVKAYVKSPKNDARDAEAICEAVTRPTMRFVPIKRVEPQDLQALHRVRTRLIKARTALVNEIRGLLNEYGIILPQGITKFRTLIVRKLEAEQAQLTPFSRELFWHLYEEFLALDHRLASDDEKLTTIGQLQPECQRLQTIPGIGPVSATALIAAIGDATQFKNGRQLAAWLGLVPREHSTGGKPRLFGMSKRGDVYLRTLLIHGARATLRWIATKPDDRSRWLRDLIARRGKNRAAVALANKNARIVWALLVHHQEYRIKPAA